MKNLDEHSIYIENQSKDWVDTSDGIVNDVKVWWGAELTLKRSDSRIGGRRIYNHV